jgi:hypothetical protein
MQSLTIAHSNNWKNKLKEFKMKSLVTAITALLMTVAAHAYTLNANDSWETIQASNEYMVSPVYPVFGPTGIFNACATATQIKAVKPVSVCVETKWVPAKNHNDVGGEVCVRYEQKITSMARSGVAAVCQEYRQGNHYDGTCIRWANEPYEIALTQAVNVITTGHRYPDTAFTKNFTIPACK